LRAVLLSIVALAGCADRPLDLPRAIDAAAAVDLAAADLSAPDLGQPDLGQPDLRAPADLAFEDLTSGDDAMTELCRGDGGTLLWAKQFTGPFNYPTGIALASTGLLVTGFYNSGSIGFGQGGLTGNPFNDYVYDVTLDVGTASASHPHQHDMQTWVFSDGSDGRVIIGSAAAVDGGSPASARDEDPDGNIRWQRDWAGSFASVVVTTDSQHDLILAVAPETPVDFGDGATGGAGQYLLVKLDATGTLIWHRPLDSSYEVPAMVSADGSGAVVVTQGFVNVAKTVAFRKYDADGNSQWTKTVPQASWCRAVAGAGGEVAYACNLGVTGMQLLIEALDAQGNSLWSRTLDGRAQSSGLAFDHRGNLVWSGPIFEAVDFGQGPLPPSGATGWYGVGVVKLDSSGHTLWSRYLSGPAMLLSGLGTAPLVLGADDSIYVASDYSGTLGLCGATVLPPPSMDKNTWVVKFAP
jgi:hypothetical protein